MWKRFIKTRCSVISYYWHKSSLVLSFPFRLFSKMFLLNRAKTPLNMHKIGSNRPDYWQKTSKFEPINE